MLDTPRRARLLADARHTAGKLPRKQLFKIHSVDKRTGYRILKEGTARRSEKVHNRGRKRVLAPHEYEAIEAVEDANFGFTSSSYFKDCVLVEDNDGPHGTKDKAFNKVKALKARLGIQWEMNPPNSPDLNPIETIWRIIKQRLKSRGVIFEEAVLRRAIQEEWDKITLDEINRASSTMPDRVAKGIFRAATSDNETCRKIESTVIPTPQPATIQFLRAAVGYSTNDCTTQFGRSLAGVQFLGLASAMNTMDTHTAATALQAMLLSSAADKTLLATTKQLKDLLASLEDRCGQSGFTNTIVGWHLFLKGMPRTQWHRLNNGHGYPSPLGIEGLVNAFRQLCRLGQTSVQRVTIRCFHSSPWVIAFTKWCLGITPSIFLENGGTLLEQPESNVIVIISCENLDDISLFEVSIQHKIAGPAELLVSEQHLPDPWHGLLSISSYADWMFHTLDLDDEAMRALRQALPYAITEASKTLRFSTYNKTFRDPTSRYIGRNQLRHLSPIPFPTDSILSKTLSAILYNSSDQAVKMGYLEDGLLVKDLPIVKLHLESLEKTCGCSLPACSNMKEYRDFQSTLPCQKNEFFRMMAFVVAQILALSLYQFPKSLMLDVHSVRRRGTPQNLFLATIFGIITTGICDSREYEACSIWTLLDWTLSLVGHNVDDFNSDNWIMSCFKGQAVYPLFYDTQTVDKSGYLALVWLPGQIRYGGETYTSVRASNPSYLPGRLHSDHDSITACKDPVTRPRNLAPDIKLLWHVEAGDGFLAVSVGLQSSGKGHLPIARSPFIALATLAASYIMESCVHDSHAELDAADKFCSYSGPIKPIPLQDKGSDPNISRIGVVAVDGAKDLQFFTLCYRNEWGVEIPMVIRIDACLKCCLNICRRSDSSILVL
ncbi:hypothetical protein GJ744_000755 [Endocarpon pusillum]|uniref:Tc1-like transposase DDE domain-containing protein n=1 Tax=Endocarpon pusillum TaxID=364733 RepID=A0A8H7AB10_9EURO|nr:hypothetical protein GJ744_000755 [Endocarpon pusillum]